MCYILHKIYSDFVIKDPKIFVETNLWNYINVDGYIELSGIDLQLECYNFIFALWYWYYIHQSMKLGVVSHENKMRK